MIFSYIRLCIFALIALSSVYTSADEYMTPNQINWFPSSLANELKKDGCKIPKNIDNYFTTGIIIGQFVARGQIDIAILCVTEKESYIRVIWGGDKSCPSKLTSIGQSITVVDGYYIWERYNAYGGNKPPDEITHEAINDHYLGKASMVHYCHKGNWISLTSAD